MQNPVGAAAVTWLGIIILALLAALLVALWVFVARRLANRESDDDPALDALRQRKLVVRRSRNARGQATVVTQLEPDPESEPRGS